MSGHASHQKGVDMDIRPVRNYGLEDPVTIQQSAYSRTLTAELLGLFEDHLPVVYLFFNDTSVPGTTTWPNHDNHVHVRIEE